MNGVEEAAGSSQGSGMNDGNETGQGADGEPIILPVDGVVDLHTFRPQEIKQVVLATIEACQEKGIRDLRIIHGKGAGILRRQVHALLDRHEAVESFQLAGGDGGGWGATLVRLRG